MAEWFGSLSPMRKALIQGQWISILIAGTGIFASILSDTHPSTNFPLFMNSCNYILLATYLLRRYINHGVKPVAVSDDNNISSVHIDTSDVISETSHNSIQHELDETSRPLNKNNILWWYVFAAILDVEANYLVLLAYNYTTITSVMLLDCFTIPVAMVLSYLFLGCRYNYMHILGTVICLLGLTCIVINDSLVANGDDAAEGSNPVLGDILCLSSAVLYASSNVLQEHLVKFHDREEFLGYLGCFGFSIAVVQCLATDLAPMRRAHYSPKVIGAMSGFVVCLFLMYTNTTSFLQHGDAVLFNLSLLTSDVYAVIFTYFFHGYLVGWLYFVAFALVMVGLFIYHSQEAPLHIGRDLGDIGMFALIQEKVCSMWCCRTKEGLNGKENLLRVSSNRISGSSNDSGNGSRRYSDNLSSSSLSYNAKLGVQYSPLADQEGSVNDEYA